MSATENSGGDRDVGKGLAGCTEGRVADDLKTECPSTPRPLTGALANALMTLIANTRELPVARSSADGLSSKAS